MKQSLSRKEQIKSRAENSLADFIQLVHPHRVLGSIHREVLQWWERSDRKSHQLLLLPRDHMKSALLAYRGAWRITKNPAIRILYISSTSNLAVKQVKFIKDILTSDIYSFYWPEMVHPDEGRREKWTETEFSVDHPLRKAETIRDPTVFSAGLTTGIVGLHCDVSVLDDVVVGENVYTEEGRKKVSTQYSFLSSIEGTDSEQWVGGTRYHPKDLYSNMVDMRVEEFNAEGDEIFNEPLYECFERPVESHGDGTGEFLWPRQQRIDGKWFGFDSKILARKRAQYLDKTQYRAQYYNDPNDYETAGITRDLFQYYNKSFLSRQDGRWYYKTKRLNVCAAVDFAYTLGKRSDYTAIVVVGVDGDRNYYVLDIDRFKADHTSDYFKHILSLHQKWDIRKIIAEATAAQSVIINELRDNYIRQHGLALSIEDFKPGREQGSKEERIEATLQPRYANRQMWHYQGGNCQTLEDELVLAHPPHDDVKDSLASAVAHSIVPTMATGATPGKFRSQGMIHSRFGGIA